MEEEDASKDVNDNNADNFVAPTKRRRLDIAGAVSITGDRLNVSCRQKVMLSASVVKAAGVSVHDTNISVSTVWRKGRKQRMETAAKIKEDFVKPEHLLIHWDDKMMKLRSA